MKTFVIKTIVILFTLFITSSPVIASTYGSGNYGEGFYSPTNTPTPTPTLTPTPGSSGGSGGSGGGNSGGSSANHVNQCGARPPDSNPFLYQVDRLGKKATLYFAPAAMPYDRYVISYGLDENAENYNATYYVTNSPGAIDYTVDLLEPGVTYYFKVLAINNCKPSGWSNVIKGEAISPYLVTKQSYFPSWYQQVVHTVSTYVSNVTKTITNAVNSNTSDSSSVQGTQDAQVQEHSPIPDNTAQDTRNSFTQTNNPPKPSTNKTQTSQAQGNWFNNLVNGFLNIFR